MFFFEGLKIIFFKTCLKLETISIIATILRKKENLSIVQVNQQDQFAFDFGFS